MENKAYYFTSDLGTVLSEGEFEYYKGLLKEMRKDKNDGSSKCQSHYQVASKQPIEVMQEVMSPEEFQGFCRGNIIKYAMRLGHKDDSVKEAGKIKQYAIWLVDSLKGVMVKP